MSEEIESIEEILERYIDKEDKLLNKVRPSFHQAHIHKHCLKILEELKQEIEGI